MVFMLWGQCLRGRTNNKGRILNNKFFGQVFKFRIQAKHIYYVLLLVTQLQAYRVVPVSN